MASRPDSSGWHDGLLPGSSRSLELSLRYVRGELSTLHRLRFELELERDARLRQEVDELLRVMRLLETDRDATGESPRKDSRGPELLEQIPEAAWTPAPRRPPSRRSRQPLVGIVVLLLAIGGLLGARALDLLPDFTRPLRDPGLASSPVDPRVALDLAHAWLLEAQGEDGSWSSGSPGEATSGPDSRVGVTGLALLSLAHSGHPAAPAAIERGLGFLLAHQHPESGLLGPSGPGAIYHHSVATLALLEHSRQSGDAALRQSVRLALAHLRERQGRLGEWGSLPRAGRLPDATASLWALRVLTEARADWRGLDHVVSRADRFVEAVDPARHRLDPRGATSRSPLPVTRLLTRSVDLSDPDLREAADRIGERVLASSSLSLHEMYFLTVALSRLERIEGARRQLEHLRQNLVERQVDRGQERGSWESTGFPGSGGRVMATALASLSLSPSPGS